MTSFNLTTLWVCANIIFIIPAGRQIGLNLAEAFLDSGTDTMVQGYDGRAD